MEKPTGGIESPADGIAAFHGMGIPAESKEVTITRELFGIARNLLAQVGSKQFTRIQSILDGDYITERDIVDILGEKGNLALALLLLQTLKRIEEIERRMGESGGSELIR